MSRASAPRRKWPCARTRSDTSTHRTATRVPRERLNAGRRPVLEVRSKTSIGARCFRAMHSAAKRTRAFSRTDDDQESDRPAPKAPASPRRSNGGRSLRRPLRNPASFEPRGLPPPSLESLLSAERPSPADRFRRRAAPRRAGVQQRQDVLRVGEPGRRRLRGLHSPALAFRGSRKTCGEMIELRSLHERSVKCRPSGNV